MQRRLNSETDVNKPFENGSCQGRIQKFFEGGGIKFRHFFKRIFSGRVTFKQLKCQKATLGGSGGMLPQKLFEILHTAMTILVLFEQFLRKVCHIFGPQL